MIKNLTFCLKKSALWPIKSYLRHLNCKNSKGFSLIELVIVMVIIGSLSSFIVFNFDILKSLNNQVPQLDLSLKEVIQESIEKQETLVWAPFNSSYRLYVLKDKNSHPNNVSLKNLKSTWNTLKKYKKELILSSGEKVVLDDSKNNLDDIPKVLFFPTGETSGLKLRIYLKNTIQVLYLGQNGQINIKTNEK